MPVTTPLANARTTIDVFLDDGLHRFFCVNAPATPFDNTLSVTTSPHLLTLSGAAIYTFSGPQDILSIAQKKGVDALRRYLVSSSIEDSDVLTETLQQLDTALALYERVSTPRQSFPLVATGKPKRRQSALPTPPQPALLTRIQEICPSAREDDRAFLHTPFCCNGMTWACNGRMLIGVDIAAATDTTETPLTNLVNEHLTLRHSNLAALPDDLPSAGETKVHCKECDGEGEMTFTSDFNTYTVSCESCDGQGHITCDEQVMLPGFPCYFLAEDIRWLRELPGLRIARATKEHTIYFTFGDATCDGVGWLVGGTTRSDTRAHEKFIDFAA